MHANKQLVSEHLTLN